MGTDQKLILLLIAIASGAAILFWSSCGLHGEHIWRFSDAYGHILGFMHFKDFEPFDTFEQGRKAVFDIPVYAWLVARFALLANLHPFTAVTLCNYACMLVIAWNGYRLCRHLGNTIAGLVFSCLFLSSPLFLHYASNPLPDILAIALAFTASRMILCQGIHSGNVLLPALLFAAAALIKSPVAFVFLTFLFFYIMLALRSGENLLSQKNSVITIIIIYATSLVFALIAEGMRTYLVNAGEFGLVDGPGWYFGTVALRLSPYFWLKMFFYASLFSIPPFSLFFLANYLIARKNGHGKTHLHMAHAAMLAHLTALLVFTNVYYLHIYYALPSALLLLVSFAISFSSYFPGSASTSIEKKTAIMNALLVVVAAAGLILTHTLIDRSGYAAHAPIRKALASENVFLHVSMLPHHDPSLGGLLDTKYVRVTPETFEASCEMYIRQYHAIFMEKDSVCFSAQRERFDSVIKTRDGIFALQNH